MTTNLLIKVLGDHLEQGFQQGLEQGVERGAVQARQEDILRILGRRYPTVPEPVLDQVRRITDPERLSAVLDSATDARSLDQFTEALEG